MPDDTGTPEINKEASLEKLYLGGHHHNGALLKYTGLHLGCNWKNTKIYSINN
ncbi:MAG: hypothetical protein WCH01_05555 [Methylococcaceae bacterium]